MKGKIWTSIAVFSIFLSGILPPALQAKEAHLLHLDGYTLAIQAQPLHITLRHKNQKILTEKENGPRSSLFYTTKEGRQFLKKLHKVKENTPDAFQAVYKTTDGRTADVSIQKGSHRNFIVSFTIHPSKGIQTCGEQFASPPDEHVTGLMERVRGTNDKESWEPGIKTGLDLRGEMVSMFVRPTVAIYAPFYLSSRGYGLWVNTTWPGSYDLAHTDPKTISFAFEGTGSLTYSIFPGPKTQTILENYTAATTRPILPPKWCFSTWRWRDDHVNLDTLYDGTPYHGLINSQLYEDVAMMDSLDIPYGVYWVDRPWAIGPSGYSDFEWDPNRFPNAEKMIRWLNRKHKKFMLWIAPWVMGKMVDEGLKRGYFMPGTQQRWTNKSATKRRALIDFTNPAAVTWWQDHLKKVIDQGVAGFKLDRSEEIVPASLDLKVYDGRTTREVHDIYPLLYVKATYGIAHKLRGDDFVLMPRAGYPGSARYGTFWGGDTGNRQWGLRCAMINVQRASLMGFPIWGSDTGGYHKPTYREVLARWLAFSCFTPIMEVGPTDNRAPWSMRFKPHYDTQVIAIWRTYAKLHTALMDYSYSLAREAHTTGHPLVRPLIYADLDNAKAWENWEEFYYGPDFLVKPIWRKGETTTTIYLPSGKWRDYWNPKKVYKGPQTVKIAVPLYKMPIFVRAGAQIPQLDLEKIYQESLKIAARKPRLNGNPKLW